MIELRNRILWNFSKGRMLPELPHPTIFAHRGASAHAPENTLAAFELALRQGADGIELDARLCADGQVVVVHDPTVDRTTDGSGKVKDLPLSVLCKLDAGSHFDVAFKGEPIPTLDEVFATIGHQTFINVDMANYHSPFDSLPEKVAKLIQRQKLTHRILVSSFNPIALRRFHQLMPKVPIGLLARSGRKGAWARGWLGKWAVPYQTLHPNINDLSEDLVQRAHREGHLVFVYTVNQIADMLRSLAMGANGIFTDDPLLARRVLFPASQRQT